MPLYYKGQLVNFQRSSISINSTPIIAVVPQINGFDGIPISEKQWYIIEYINGWIPDLSRINKYELNSDDKYLFVLEDELEPA